MLWKLLGSEQKVEAALRQSKGYDISPAVVQMPANMNDQDGEKKLSLWTDYAYVPGPADDADETVFWNEARRKG